MDPLPIEFHPRAIEDARSAREWYAERNSEAAEAFMAELDEAVEQISQFPNRWAQYILGTRHFLLNRFPFVLVSREIADTIQVIAVAHAKRKPGFWGSRLEK